MAEEGRRRRRGRRRGRDGGHQPEQPPADQPTEEGRDEEQPEVTEESEAPGVLPSRPRFRFGRGGGGDEGKSEEGQREDREDIESAATPADVSPLSFWRRGRTRTYREQPMPKQTLGRTMRRMRGMQFPPWVPVAFIIVVVFGILGVLFLARGAAGAPRNGDHWHATYQVSVCGERQPNLPFWEGDIHTHGDGVIHMHPFTPTSEGAGARLVKWFEYGGGKLTQSEMRMPGRRETLKNGDDTCGEGAEPVLRVFANDEQMDDWSRYIAQDGDRVRIEFGPEGMTTTEQEDRIVIDESEATRTVEVAIAGAEADASFEPASIDLRPGETVKLIVKNTGSISHQARAAGADGEYNTIDDYVSEPETILTGEEGVLLVRFDEAGEFEFQDPSSPNATGTLVVAGEPVVVTDETGPADGSAETVDVTLDLSMGDSFFEPNGLEVEAGQSFRINLTNNGTLVHNLRIAGLDNEYETGDDLISIPSPLGSGEGGELVGQIDEPGVYSFRSDFQAVEMTGTITVK